MHGNGPIQAMKTILMLNWGLGLQILKSFHERMDTDIVAVVTQYNPYSSDPWENCVHDYSALHGYTTLNQDSISYDDLYAIIIDQKVDLLFSHAFMRKIPDFMVKATSHGAVNIHPSLLPLYRGPSPSYWVLKNKERITGLTSHYIDDGIDTGDIIYQVEIPVNETDNFESLVDRLKGGVSELINESMLRINDRSFVPVRQNHRQSTYAPKPSINRG